MGVRIQDAITAAARRRGLGVPPFELDRLPGEAVEIEAEGMEGGDDQDLWVIGGMFEALMEGSGRKSVQGKERRMRGAFYTPRGMVRSVVRRCVRLGRAGGARAKEEAKEGGGRVLDPAVGAGFFLLEAGERLAGGDAGRRTHVAVHLLFGVDIDAASVELARCLVWLWAGGADAAAIRENLVVGDGLGLEGRWAWPATKRFDAVVGNPPFVDSERLSAERPGFREQARDAFRSAVGNWDLSVLFVERALSLCVKGGRVGMVLPWRAVASDSAVGLMSELLRHRVEVIEDWAGRGENGRRAFRQASVPVLTVVVKKVPGKEEDVVEVVRGGADAKETKNTGDRRGSRGHPTESPTHVSIGTLRRVPAGLIGAALELGDGPTLCRVLSGTRLGDVAEICDGATTSEAYAIRPLMRQARSTRVPKGWLKVVNTGTIDPGRVLWGEREMSYLGFKGTRPVVRAVALRKISARREAQAMRAKVVVAGLAARLEAAVVPAGVLCGKSAMQVLPRAGVSVAAIAEYLNSVEASTLYRAMFGRRGFSAKSMAIGARQLRLLPWPGRERVEVDEVGSASDLR